MTVKGRIHVFNNPQSGNLEVTTENMGVSPGLFTHNILPSEQLAKSGNSGTQHDDMRYGHGDPVPAGTENRPGTITKNFPLGQTYNGTQRAQIEHGSWIRVGFRHASWQALPIPRPGDITTIDFADMAAGNTLGGAASWRPQRTSNTVGANRNLTGPLAKIYGAVYDGPPNLVQGSVEIKPVADGHGRLRGWEVWMNNEANFAPTRGRTTGFVGTVVLTDPQGRGEKNAGLGLESMVCPAGGYSTMQFIEAGGDYGNKKYGVRGEPGTAVRLGIRGHSSFEARLPALHEGPQRIKLTRFKEGAEESKSDWFETDALQTKLGEKKALVEIYRDGKRINDELPDTIYRGEEAFARAEFKDPPRVQIAWVDQSDELPNGGWKVKITNRLPDNDDLGALGFTARLGVPRQDNLQPDPAQEHRRAFDPENRKRTFHLPVDRPLAGTKLAAGQSIAVDTGALAWRGTFKLPAPGRKLDSEKDDRTLRNAWVLRETDYKRRALNPKVVLRGDVAENHAPHPSPQLSVRRVADSEETPGGGWLIEMENTLPKNDQQGPLGFVGTLKLGVNGKDPARLPPKKFEQPGDTNRWFIAENDNVGGIVAEANQQLLIGTRGLGWYAVVRLPEQGDGVEDGTWAFREDQFTRNNLDPDFIQGCKLGPDQRHND